MKTRRTGNEPSGIKASSTKICLQMIVHNSKVTLYFPHEADDTVVSDIKRMMIGCEIKKGV